MTGSGTDAAIATVARAQHGVWSRRQAVTIGASPKLIRVRTQRGDWLRVDNAVFAHAAAPSTWERSVMAAVLAEPWAVASHRTAAALRGVEGFRPGRPEITVRPGANARGALAIVHRGKDVRATAVDGIPTVTLDQVFIDLAQVVTERRLRAALGSSADRHPGLIDSVRDRYCDLKPRGGRDLRTLGSVLETFGAGEAPDRSELEHRLVRALDVPGMPPVDWEVAFPGRSPGPQRVDALIRSWSIVIEADGRAWHTRIEDFERDRRRDAEAAAAGYLTLRFTWHQLTQDVAWARRIVFDAGALRAAA